MLARVYTGYALGFAVLAVVVTPRMASGQRELNLAPTTTADLNQIIVLINGFLVFFMQVGFVALETGSGRAKNVRNILLKNTVDVMLCGLCWWAVGWAFAYGDTAGGFIGRSGFFFNNLNTSHPWFFSFTFCLTCMTIVSGCLAERTQLIVYPIYTVIICAFVHPLVVHWTWHSNGWLQTISRCRFMDFAGGTVVHMIGGFVGLVGATLCGPRMGRFEEGMVKDMQPHDMVFVSLGTFMLWFGWYGFNCGSAFLYNGGPYASTRAALCTTLAASSSGLTALLLAHQKTGTFDVRHCCNGLLAGLVAITSCAGFVEPWAAVVIGAITGPLYIINSRLLLRLRIDDPLDSSTVHFASGIVGTLAVAFFAKPEYALNMASNECAGILYVSSGWTQLGVQTLGVVVVLALTGVVSLAVFKILDRLNMLRVDQATELAGIDNMEHGGPAYPEFAVQLGNNTHSSNGFQR